MEDSELTADFAAPGTVDVVGGGAETTDTAAAAGARIDGNSAFTLDGFEDYHVETRETPTAFRAIVGLWVVLAVVFAAPLACWTRDRRKRRRAQANKKKSDDGAAETASEEDQHERNTNRPKQNEQQQQQPPDLLNSHVETAPLPPRLPQQRLPTNVADLSIFHQEHLAAMKAVAQEAAALRFSNNTAAGGTAAQLLVAVDPATITTKLPHSFPETAFGRRTTTRSHNAASASAVPSVASTSRLYGQRRRGNSLIGTMRSRVVPWSRNGRPLARPQVVQQGVEQERQSYLSGEIGGGGGEGSLLSHHSRSRSSWGSPGNNGGAQHPLFLRPKIVSDAAGSVLEGESVEGEAEYYRQRYRQRAHHHQHHRRTHSRTGGSSSLGGGSSSDLGSIMPPLDPDCVSPEDAADAHDPGRASHLMFQYNNNNNGNSPNNQTGHYDRHTHRTASSSQPSSEQPSNALQAQLLNVLDLAETDYECRRLLTLAVPSTVGAMADPFFRIVLVAIISHFIDTDSMVAYLIVILFIRLTTEEISGAIADTESNLLQTALSQGGDYAFFQAGQIIQLAVVVQLAVGIPILLLWYFLMDDVADWLVDGDPEISEIAATYTGVIIIDYTLKGASRTLMLPFYLTGQAQFEVNIDLAATILTLVAIAVVATTKELSLAAIGWVQVIIGMAKMILKIAYVSLRGWLRPYQQGLLHTASFRNPQAVSGFLLQALPLFLGSLLELGEWEVLILFVSHLGGAEVSTWAIMGVIWEIFVAFTEGIGEAASVRVSFFLSEGLPDEAKRLANKVTFMSFVLVLTVSSIFLMAGPNIAVALSTDNTLQHLFYDLVGFAALANVSMTFAQVYWSLAGAQGRYSVASATILFCRWFIVLPMASICIYPYDFDLVAVAGSVAVGYAVAALALSFQVFCSDWDAIAQSMMEEEEFNPLMMNDDVGGEGYPTFEDGMRPYVADDDDDDDDDEDDSSYEDEEESSDDSSSSYHSSSEDEDDKPSDQEEEEGVNPTDEEQDQSALLS